MAVSAVTESAAASGDAMDTDGPGSSSADRSAKPADGSEPEAKSFKCSEYAASPGEAWGFPLR